MFSYEQDRSAGEFYLYHQFDTDLQFPLHLHHSFECIYVEEGELWLQVGSRELPVKAGYAALIFPDQPHAYRTPHHCNSYLCVFSQDYLYDFSVRIRGQEAEDPTFWLKDPAPIALLNSPEENIFLKKAALYTLAGQFLTSCPLRPVSAQGEGAMLERVILYVQQHFTEPISLGEVAANTGYQYNYLSTSLHRQLHMHFTEFINRYRVEWAAVQLRQTDLPVTEIAQGCGFNTIRSFNRNFLRLQGMTPLQYRMHDRK